MCRPPPPPRREQAGWRGSVLRAESSEPAMKLVALADFDEPVGEQIVDEGEEVVPDPLGRSVVLCEQRRVHGRQGGPGAGRIAEEVPGARPDLIEAEVDSRFRIEEDRLSREVAKED